MTLSNEQLEEITENAKLLFSKREVATILQIPLPLLHTDEFETAYQRGYLLSQVEFRAVILRLSSQGSTPAQNIVSKMIEQTDLNNLMDA